MEKINKGFKKIEGDIDFDVIEKTIYGKITPYRWLLLQRYARKHSRRYGNCGHEWDCCGCLSSRYTDVHILGKNGFYYGAKITIRFSYNY